MQPLPSVRVWTSAARRCLPCPATYAARVAHDERASGARIVDRDAGRRSVHHLIRHPGTPLVLLTIAAAVIVIGTFAPWLRSGSTTRSSYDLLGLMSRLGIAPQGFVSTLVRWWPLVPLLATSAVVSAWWRWTSVAVAAAIVSVLYSGGVGTAIVVKSRSANIAIGPGPWICAIGGVAMLVAAGWLAVNNATGRGAATPAATRPDDQS